MIARQKQETLSCSRVAPSQGSLLDMAPSYITARNLCLSLCVLTPEEWQKLDIQDSCDIFRFIGALFPGDPPGQSFFLYADQGIANSRHQLLILSEEEPMQPVCGSLDSIILPPDYFDARFYDFRIMIIMPQPQEQLAAGCQISATHPKYALQWILTRAPGWGFTILPGQLLTMPTYTTTPASRNQEVERIALAGCLKVTNKLLFAQSVRTGIGPGREYGCGLLQLTPREMGGS